MEIETIKIIHLLATFFMLGLIWTIQWVHYPSFIYIDKTKEIDFQTFHMQRITMIVMPIMIIELLSLLYLVTFDYQISHLILFSLTLIIWLITFFCNVPVHNRLIQNYRKEDLKKLVLLNWPRTILWTLKSSYLIFLFV